jgi:hypothetical protein
MVLQPAITNIQSIGEENLLSGSGFIWGGELFWQTGLAVWPAELAVVGSG